MNPIAEELGETESAEQFHQDQDEEHQEQEATLEEGAEEDEMEFADLPDADGGAGAEMNEPLAAIHESGDAPDGLAAKTEGASTKEKGNSDIDQVNFDELVLTEVVINSVQRTWRVICNAAGSRAAVGESMFTALFDQAPSLQSLFKTPKAVTAVRLSGGLDAIVAALSDPPAGKKIIEDLAFRHLMFEITVPRIILFRDILMNLLEVELADQWDDDAKSGWLRLFNHAGGGMMFIKSKYSGQLVTLGDSWRTVVEKCGGSGTGAKKEGDDALQQSNASGEPAKDGEAGANNSSTQVPTSFDEMVHFNATVMGCSSTAWLDDMLRSWDGIVTNLANSTRLEEECQIVALKLSKHPPGAVDLSVFKACLLASLRSLLPRQWDSAHEVAWLWLWENVEKLVTANIGVPAKYQQSLETFTAALTAESQLEVGKAIYKRVFEVAPTSQDFFRQSNARLYYIADKVLYFSLQIYRTPAETFEDLSALGLRHVGYEIPTELFGPFVSSCCDVVRVKTNDEQLVESFMWSLSLTAKIMVRMITEGRTVIMMAINANSQKQLRRGMSVAPRRLRTTWLLHVQVGKQSISPLAYAIESGLLPLAESILIDVLTIRADRDRYYFGLDELFARHPDIIKMLGSDAPSLLPILLNGLVWRSRHVQNGMRRVNYYVKHLIVDSKDGHFSDALDAIVQKMDPVIINHPVLVLVADLFWTGIVRNQFMSGEIGFVFGLAAMTFGESILPRVYKENPHDAVRILVIVCRALVYLVTAPQFIYEHGKQIISEIRKKEYTTAPFIRIPIPDCLREMHNSARLVLTVMILIMLCHEPALWFGFDNFLGELGPSPVKKRYHFVSMMTTVMYWLLLVNLSVFSTTLSAFMIVAVRMSTEMMRFFAGLMLLFIAFGCGACTVQHHNDSFRNITSSITTLASVTLGMFEPDYATLLRDDPALLSLVLAFMFVAMLFMINLLVAQLNCSYEVVSKDMVGLARLRCASLIVRNLEICTEKRWQAFLGVMQLDNVLELNEGDLGPASGIQVYEPSNRNLQAEELDNIHRFGGSTSPEQPWVEGEGDGNMLEDRLDSLEQMCKKIAKKVADKKKKFQGAGGGDGATGSHHTGGSDDSDGGGGDE